MDDTQPEHAETVDSAAYGRPLGRRGWRTALVTSSAVLMVGAGAGAVAVGSYLSGGGAQPDDVLRSGALAFAKVDLDPAAGQKLAVYQLSRKFPGLLEDLGEDRALKDSIFAKVFDDGGSGTSYAEDVRPWLGDRAGIAVYPPAAEGTRPRVAVAVAFTDEAKMTAALVKDEATGDIDWAVRDGYVVVTGRPAEADDLVAGNGGEALASQADYSADVAALDGSRLAVAWADYGRLTGFFTDAMTAGLGRLAAGGTAEGMRGALAGRPAVIPEVSGRFAMGVRAGRDFLEVQGVTFDVAGADRSGRAPGTNLAGQMPADSFAALSVSGIGAGLAEQWKSVAGTPMGFTATAKQLGLDLPADFAALFGDETALSVGSGTGAEPQVLLRSRGGDAARAKQLVALLTSLLGIAEPTAKQVADGFVIGNDPAQVRALAAGAAKLADTDSFTRAAPDAAGAGVVAYANIARVISERGGDGPEAAKLEALDAVGFTATSEQNPSFRLRLTVR